MATDTPRRTTLDDPLEVATFLDRVAQRIADALYYEKLDAIGINGSVSPGLLHDDYDRLRRIAKQMRRAEYLRLADDSQP